MHNSSDIVTVSRLSAKGNSYTRSEMAHFGTWLRDKRKEMRLSQGEVAKRAGISTSYVSTLERGERHHLTEARPQPTLEVVDSLAEALGANLDEARDAAGYAMRTRIIPAKTARELFDALEKLGINIGGTSLGEIADMTPEQFDAFRSDLEKAIGVTIALHRK